LPEMISTRLLENLLRTMNHRTEVVLPGCSEKVVMFLLQPSV